MPKGDGLTLIQRFWGKVEKKSGLFALIRGHLSECWIWTAGKNGHGYGYFWIGPGKADSVQAYKFAYEITHGPVPDGLHLDHLCRRPLCVRPSHVEPVTHRENILRGETFPAANVAKTACPRGHPYDMVFASGKRGCSVCLRAARLARYRADPEKYRKYARTWQRERRRLSAL